MNPSWLLLAFVIGLVVGHVTVSREPGKELRRLRYLRLALLRWAVRYDLDVCDVEERDAELFHECREVGLLHIATPLDWSDVARDEALKELRNLQETEEE